MSSYTDLAQADILAGLPIFFAYNSTQFEAGLRQLGCDKSELVSVPGGGYMRREDGPLLIAALHKHEQALAEYLNTDEGLLEALEYELANYEFCVTYDADEALSVLNLSADDPRVRRLLPIAIAQCLDGVDCEWVVPDCLGGAS